MTGYTSLLKKTGQTTSYVTGDDGDLEKGVAHSYTVLDSGQYSGTTDITVAGATDSHSNNCVQDNMTGLMWLRYIAGNVGIDFGKGRTSDFPWTTDGSGIGIWEYLSAANAASLAGHTDWRIPNIYELITIYLVETGFPDVTAWDGFIGFLWSSNTLITNTTYSFQIPYSWDVSIIQTTQKIAAGRLLLVRGDPTAPTAGGNSLISGMVD
jgi:hypothetical protein